MKHEFDNLCLFGVDLAVILPRRVGRRRRDSEFAEDYMQFLLLGTAVVVSLGMAVFTASMILRLMFLVMAKIR